MGVRKTERILVKPSTAVFCFEAGPGIGLGHAARCLALADALTDLGWTCHLAVSDGTRAALAVIAPQIRYPVIACRRRESTELEAVDLAAALPGTIDLLVIDDYRVDRLFARPLRAKVRRILAIDDAPGRVHDADILLDQNSTRHRADYAALVNRECNVLTGPAYALLRPDFRRARLSSLCRRLADASFPSRVLVALGGVAPVALLRLVLSGIRRAVPDAHIDVVAGLSDVAALGGAGSIRIHAGAPDMARLLAGADLAVGAGGVSAFERCCVGLPSLVIEMAENQRAVIFELTSSGAAVPLGRAESLDVETLAEQISALATDSARRIAMIRAAALLCDGLGARRVAGLLSSPFARDGVNVTLRPARHEDGARMLVWQQHPATRRFAHNPSVPTPREHFDWLARRLGDPVAGPFSIVMHGDTPAGVLRLDRCDTAIPEVESYLISILVDPALAGHGIGSAALSAVRQLVPDADLIAEVHPANAPSHALFRAAGFELAASGRYESRPAGAPRDRARAPAP